MANTEKTLDQQIEERKQQATNRKIFEKANLIVEKLGQRDSKASYGGKDYESIVHVFNDAASGLEVRHTENNRYHGYIDSRYDEYNMSGALESSSRSLAISFEGKQVFYRDGYGSISAYIPGTWEKKLDALHDTVQQTIAKEKAEAARKAAAKAAAEAREAAKRTREAEKAKRAQWGL